jgi:hypothetical protein
MCNNTVIQTVPSGYDYKFIEMKCGSTSIYGDELRCEECENGGPPWYICPHGRDVSEYDCGLCELD